MKSIIEGNRDVAALVKQSLIANNAYVLSRYVISQRVEDALLLYSTVTGELLILSCDEAAALDNLPACGGSLVGELVSKGFLVLSGKDEGRRIEQLRAIISRRREANKVINRYIILPTTGCNARCFYCYQSDFKHSTMTEQTAESLVRFIQGHSRDSVMLSWFGGEPSLMAHRIDQICTMLSQLEISYVSDMVTNGYLFDENLVCHAKELWHLNDVQVTLDGMEATYNKVKSYVGVTDNPYRRVVRNIGLFLDQQIHVAIRLNLDKHNADELMELIDELSECFSGRKNLSVYVKRLNEGDGFNPIEHDDEDLARLKERYHELQGVLEDRGWPQIRKFTLPRLHAFCCMADDPRSIQCSPDGLLGKCEDRVFEHTVGTLSEGIIDYDEIRWWQQRTDYPECATCPLYPSCVKTLKHCPTRADECDELDRKRRMRLSRDAMLDAYEKWKTELPVAGDSERPGITAS